MADNSILTTIGVVATIGILLFSLAKRQRYKRKLEGMYAATTSLMIGVGRHYEAMGEPIPETVNTAIDKLNAVKDRRSFASKCAHYELSLVSVGEAMGKACWKKGFEEGKSVVKTM